MSTGTGHLLKVVQGSPAWFGFLKGQNALTHLWKIQMVLSRKPKSNPWLSAPALTLTVLASCGSEPEGYQVYRSDGQARLTILALAPDGIAHYAQHGPYSGEPDFVCSWEEGPGGEVLLYDCMDVTRSAVAPLWSPPERFLRRTEGGLPVLIPLEGLSSFDSGAPREGVVFRRVDSLALPE